MIHFQAHRTRHAVVSVIVDGQSFRTHLISPALHDSCQAHQQCHAEHAVELFLYYMIC